MFPNIERTRVAEFPSLARAAYESPAGVGDWSGEPARWCHSCFHFENELNLLVHVISRPTINAAARRYPDATDWLHAWWTIASKAEWSQLADVRQQYPTADQVDCCLIFDARGNNYRLICRVSWRNKWTAGTLLVKHFLTHAQYDRNHWRADCR